MKKRRTFYSIRHDKKRKTLLNDYQSGISLYDIFKTNNFPMFKYFNLKLNQKTKTDSIFFEKKIQFGAYLHYFFCLKKQYCNIKVLEKFHRKLLSEEYLYHLHIILYIIYKTVLESNK